MILLNKGLKYNLNHKSKHRLSNTALEAEAATWRLPTGEQEHVRYHVVHNLQKRYKLNSGKHTGTDRNMRNKIKTINQIKIKLKEADAIVTKADKGNSIIRLNEDDYNSKIHTFISSNSFSQSAQDITNKLQRNIRTAINECSDIIPKDKKWKYINLNPSTPPTIRGLVKIYKEESPIRPIINWKNTPAYKFAKALVKKK
jgi:hypothetical protein